MSIRKRGGNEKEELEVTTNSKSPKSMFVELCSDASIPGVRYFTVRKPHWTERLWWIIAFVLSSIVCGLFIHDAWIKWNQSSFKVDQKSMPISSIPFPAVTICPETKAYKEKFNFTAMYHTMNGQTPPYDATAEEIANMEAMSHICEPHLTENIALGTNTTDKGIFKIINELAPSFTDTMFYCKYQNKFNSCKNYFKTILTEDGVCFTFNALNSKEVYTEKMAPEMMTVTDNPTAKTWNLENGYQNDANPESYPYRAFGAGARVGLFTLLRLFEEDLDYACRGPVQGFKVLFHPPNEVPQISKNYFRVPLAQEVLVSVKPIVKSTSESLRHYEPKRRECYFNSERQLQFFKSYTQKNCELECLTYYMLKECGCVKFSMPRDKNTPICGAAKVQCYNKAEDKLLRSNYLESLKTLGNAQKGCNCLPACTSITYDAEISQSKFDYENVFEAFQNPLTEFPGMQPARLSIYFKEPQFTMTKRSEEFGITYFVAICGGLLSLFVGISVLRILEIVYFFILRICGCVKRVRQQTSSIPSENKDDLSETNNVEPVESKPETSPIYPDLNENHQAIDNGLFQVR